MALNATPNSISSENNLRHLLSLVVDEEVMPLQATILLLPFRSLVRVTQWKTSI